MKIGNENINKKTKILTGLTTLGIISMLTVSIGYIGNNEKLVVIPLNEFQLYKGELFNKNEEIKEVDFGYDSAALVTNDGVSDHLYTWGTNKFGVLGLGDDNDDKERDSKPNEVDINQDGIFGIEGTIKQIVTGGDFDVVITNDGMKDHLYTWGDNYYGQLGLGDSDRVSRNFAPTEVNINEDEIKQVDVGYSSVVLLTTDGDNDHIYTWGNNEAGQLGLGDATSQERNFKPNEVDINQNGILGDEGKFKQVAMGDYHAAAISEKNELYMWGKNDKGQCTFLPGTGNYVTTPHKIDLEPSFNKTLKEVSLGDNFTILVTNDGTKDHAYSWGSNVSGQLGVGVSTDDIWNTRNQIDIDQNGEFGNEGKIKQVHATNEYVEMVTNDGVNDHLYVWGDNGAGQLGVGNNNDDDSNYTPNEIELNLNGSKIKQSSASNYVSAVIINDGTNDHLYTWGLNNNSQLGHGHTGINQTNFKPTEVINVVKPLINDAAIEILSGNQASVKWDIVPDSITFSTTIDISKVTLSATKDSKEVTYDLGNASSGSKLIPYDPNETYENPEINVTYNYEGSENTIKSSVKDISPIDPVKTPNHLISSIAILSAIIILILFLLIILVKLIRKKKTK